MEAVNDGELVRQHHLQPKIRVSRAEGTIFRIQRIAAQKNAIPIHCSSVYVSKFHCEIFRRDKAFWIKDLKSTNGTFLNGIKLTENKERELRFGDVIGIGISHLEPDPSVDLTDPKYFIFLFQKMENIMEVIDLEDDSDEPETINNVESNAKTSKQVDSEDIELVSGVEPIPSASASNASSSPKKPRPPAPPPPIISLAMLSKMSDPSTISKIQDPVASSSGVLTSLADRNADKKRIPGPQLHTVTTPASSVNASELRIPSRARIESTGFNDVFTVDSSDDSSDGLGEVPYTTRLASSSDKAYLQSGDSSSSDSEDGVAAADANKDEQLNNLTKQSSHNINEEVNNVQTKPSSVSSPRTSNSANEDNVPGTSASVKDLSEPVNKSDRTAVGSSSASANLVRQQNTELEELTRIAQKSKSIVKLHQAIIFQNKRFTLSRKMFEALTSSTRDRMRKQFETSLRTFKPEYMLPQKQSSNTGKKSVSKIENKKSEKRKISSPTPPSDSEEESEEEEVVPSTSKYKRIRQISPESTYTKAGDSEDDEMDEDVSDDNAESVEVPSPREPCNEEIQSSSAVPTANRTPLSTKLISLDDAPLPRFAARAQNKAAAFKQPMPNQTSRYEKLKSNIDDLRDVSTSPMTRDEQKSLRSQKLKEVELRKQLEREEMAITTPKKIQPAKIKVTTRNRNQWLMESICGSGFNESEGESTRNVESQPSSSRNLQQEDSVTKQHGKNGLLKTNSHGMEFNNLNNHQFSTPAYGNSSGETSNWRPNITAVTIAATSTEYILKPGAEIIKSPSPGIGSIAYKEMSKGSTSSGKPTSSITTGGRNGNGIAKTLLEEDDIYKRILDWNPAWIVEQKTKKEPPPLFALPMTLTNTLVNYQSYRDYLYTYYPLLLFEIWATISSEAEIIPKNNPGKRKRSDYKICIDSVKRPQFCSFVKDKRAIEKGDEGWCEIRYHTFVSHPSEVEDKEDFVLLTLPRPQSGSSKTNIETSKLTFGFRLHSSKLFERISGDVKCDKRLRGKDSNGCGWRYSETIMCRLSSNFKVDKSELGHIKKICYIMAKIREFRTLNSLQSCALFDQIVSPPIPKHIWKENSTTKSHEMISRNLKLNREQQSMISHMTERIFSDEPELMLLHGPPGTGKTTTIVSLVMQLLVVGLRKSNDKRRILICTPSNAAIDEIIRRLESAVGELPNTGKRIEITRVGEGYSQQLEKYTISSKVREKDSEKTATTSLKVELASLESEIDEKKRTIQQKKSSPKFSTIQIDAELCELKELQMKRDSIKRDLNQVTAPKFRHETYDENRFNVLKDSHIICSTLSSCSNSLMKNVFGKFITKEKRPFLCCIVDEASQTTEPESLLPLVLEIDKLLLVGDPKQLGATVKSPEAEQKDYGQSLFTRLFKYYRKPAQRSRNPTMMLKQQYRMHPGIVLWPNLFFYDSQLSTKYSGAYKYPLRPYSFISMSSQERSEKPGHIENAEEIKMVEALVETLEEILCKHHLKFTIGIITPYAGQKHGIKKAFEKKVSTVFDNIIDINTVDGFQGQEKDIIILSCVRTESTGFLKCRNRLNVALTRAKHSLYIIGDSQCLSKDETWKSLIQDAAQRKCKFDVRPNFQTEIKVLKTMLSKHLTDLPGR